jgi:PAS domain S-box-containing protein
LRQLLLVTQKGFRWPDLPEFIADDRPFHLSLTDVDGLENRLHTGSDSYEAILVDGALDEEQSVRVVGKIRSVTSDIPLMWVSATDEFPASVCQSLEDYQYRMRLLLENLAEGFWEWSLDSGEVTFSTRWQAMLGYREQDLAPTFSSWIDLIHPDDLGRFLVIWIDYMEGCIERFHVEYRMKTRDGHYMWVESRGSSIRGENGQPIRLAGSHNDISLRKRVELQLKHSKEELELAVEERTRELQNANELLQRLSRVDPLTNLANRRCLDEIIERERARGRRQAGSLTMSLIVVDIDFFKAFNDTYGHLEGDQILVTVAN